MVRLKHRYLLVDLLYPASEASATSDTAAPPCLRFRAPTPDSLTPALLARLVREEVAAMFGDWGVGRLGGAGAGSLSVKYLSPATSTAIIRCPRASFRLVWSALTYLSFVPGAPHRGPSAAAAADGVLPCVFRVVKVSGTMRKAEEEAVRRAKREIARLRRADDDAAVLDCLLGTTDSVDPAMDLAMETAVDPVDTAMDSMDSVDSVVDSAEC